MLRRGEGRRVTTAVLLLTRRAGVACDASFGFCYTLYVAVHPLRRDAPEQKGCNAYGSGALSVGTSESAVSELRSALC